MLYPIELWLPVLRRGRDSNPRYSFWPYNSLANCRLQPLGHLSSRLARLTGETKTEAVTRALRDRLSRITRDRQGRRLADELDQIALSCARRPVQDGRTADEILGYDEGGVPR